MGPSAIEKLTDYPFYHRARLIKPILSYDGAAVALSFLPAAGESLPSNPSQEERSKEDDKFTYHHLRRDLFNIARSTGVSIDSRYVVPSSHITVCRFLTQSDHDDAEKMTKWFETIDEVNRWLENEFWPKEGEERDLEAEWLVGDGKGLDCREGALWYGGGITVRLGRGF